MTRNPGEKLFLLAVLAALAGLCFSIIPPGLSSSEEAVQYVQMKNFTLHSSREILSPAFGLGVEAKDLAGRRGFFESRSGRLYATPPPLFPWVASLFFPVFGERTVDFAPILFVFLSALVLGLILDRVMKRDVLYWLLLALFLAGSPVFLQNMLFSGMALALFLITSTLWLMVSHFGGNPSAVKLFGASILMGISALARPECIFVAFSFYLSSMIVLTVQKRMKDLGAVLAGCAVGACAFALHDVVLHGRFPGPYLQLFLPFHKLSPVRLAALSGAAIGSCTLLVLSRKEGIGMYRAAVLSILSVLVVFEAVLVTAARITVSHLMALFPAVLFVFYGTSGRLERVKKGEGTLEDILAAAVVVSLVLGASIQWPEPRVVLSVWTPMIPLVIVFLALERRTLFAAPGMAVVLAFFCGVAFVNGIQVSKERILQYRDYNAACIAFLERHTSAGDVVLFEDAEDVDHAGALFFDRIFLIARTPDDRDRLIYQIRERGVDRMFVWTNNPLGIEGFNPYGRQVHPAYPLPPGARAGDGGPYKGRSYRLVRLETGAGQGGS